MTTVTKIFHSCFLVETDDAMLVFDYWRDPDGVLHNRLSATAKTVYFFVSHFHEDHYNPGILSWPQGKSPVAPRLMLSYDTVKRRRVPPALPTAVLRPGAAYEDELLRVVPFRSTDVGVSTAVVVKRDDTRLFHAGDLNNWYFPSSEPRLKVSPREMEALFLSILRDIRKEFPRFDHVMFPVDPRLGDEMHRGPRQWQAMIATAHFHPMHQWESGMPF